MQNLETLETSAKEMWGDRPMHLYAYIKDGKWKGSKVYNLSRDDNYKPAWKYHLQQMVLSDDPNEYIKNNYLNMKEHYKPTEVI